MNNNSFTSTIDAESYHEVKEVYLDYYYGKELRMNTKNTCDMLGNYFIRWPKK